MSTENKGFKLPVLFPVFDNDTEDIEFRRHSKALAEAMLKGAANYMAENTDDPPTASSMGAACFVVYHLIASSFEDQRKDQVKKGFVATLALNDPNSMLSLATNPPTNEKMN